MGRFPVNAFEPVPFRDVVVTDDAYWLPRIKATLNKTLPAILTQLKATGRWDVFRLTWQPGQPNPPHIFWDSDTAKFLEAACYALVKHHSPELRAHVEEQIDWIRASQWKDGYINSYFSLVEPQNRFSNLRDCHELYCAGHLLEAAIAHYQLSGSTRFLNAILRYVTLIQSTFGDGEDQIHGYPGHEELELALVRLYRITRAPEHLQLARYFIEERGQRRNGVHFYEAESKRNGVTLWPGHWKRKAWFEYMQAGQPIREQSSIEGHAVRAMYFLCGASDVGLHLNDTSLLAALVRLYRDVIEKKMYVTYGIGSVPRWEGFGDAYDLPNDTAFCETCADIGLLYLSHRLLRWDWNALVEYGLSPGVIADIMEGALYNSISGSTSGRSTTRKDWFDTSCCPPNVARLFCSLGEYPFMVKKRVREGKIMLTIAVVLYIDSRAEIKVGGENVTIIVKTGWPWTGQIDVSFKNAQNVEVDLLLRVPGWAKSVSHGNPPLKDGFLRYPSRKYTTETISLTIPFPVTFIQPNPLVRQDEDKVAIRRGPLIFAMDSADNDFELTEAEIEQQTCVEETFSIEGMQLKRIHIPGRVGKKERTLKFIPYWSWANRGYGDVLVWCKLGMGKE